ncbi:MAG: helix-turn-helix domain-containing protein [Lactobacillus sp.]|jgi:predicted transcriptional regulator YheO|nr:helix-turn-helix domain-containing protein [Lactobacillus sp.]MCH3906257.1 helix-turn-helix domain-containing protein [Lactobacillus sp.]MCH3990167.1 helix-turn-helix domain-containing protein [Lactobacillus sp.]MCH4069119.1 helix-turn-helix domain-containing protein [Lactobacillus sp.]MCI1303894.1 helix-turn-helix domain-containing protein [Lactobacillus sp.]
MDILNIPQESEKSNHTDEPEEVLATSVEGLIYSVVDPKMLQSNMLLSPKQKEKLISELHIKGVFSVKGSVQKVAKILRISEPTIYRYLRNLK